MLNSIAIYANKRFLILLLTGGCNQPPCFLLGGIQQGWLHSNVILAWQFIAQHCAL